LRLSRNRILREILGVGRSSGMTGKLSQEELHILGIFVK
jgi:hypothetical protein